MSGCFIFSFIVAFQLNTQAQSSPKCFTDFNFYKNEGVGVLDNCHAGYFVRCFTNGRGIYKLVASLVDGDESDYIKSYENENFKIITNDSFYMYIFPKSKMPLENKLFRTANDNRFDTLLSKNDTLYFKKAYPNFIQLSKYFRLAKDTICIVSFYYNNLNRNSKLNLTFQNINKWGSDQKYSGFAIIKLIINTDSVRFVSINSDAYRFSVGGPKDLNEIIQRLKVPPSLFWMCMIFRFMV